MDTRLLYLSNVKVGSWTKFRRVLVKVARWENLHLRKQGYRTKRRILPGRYPTPVLKIALWKRSQGILDRLTTRRSRVFVALCWETSKGRKGALRTQWSFQSLWILTWIAPALLQMQLCKVQQQQRKLFKFNRSSFIKGRSWNSCRSRGLPTSFLFSLSDWRLVLLKLQAKYRFHFEQEILRLSKTSINCSSAICNGRLGSKKTWS